VKLLFVCLPGTGHIRPLLPLARAAAAAGNTVRFAARADFVPMVEAAGFPCAAVGPTREQAKQERLRRFPESAAVDPVEEQRFQVRRVWAGIYAPRMLPDLERLVAADRPDLIVHDALAFAVPLLAAGTGIPAVSHSTCSGFSRELLDLAGEELAALWRARGVARPPAAAGCYGTLHIDVWPQALQPDDLGERGRVVSIATEDDDPQDGREQLPDWFAALPDRPTVHMTLGTVFNLHPEVFRAVLEGLADEPVNVLASVGVNQDPDVIGPLPANARVERWIPHAALLPTCTAVVCHGGAGTVLKTLRHGLPLLLLPQGSDMFRTARTCSAYGLARALVPGEVTARAVREEFGKLTDDPSYRARAQAMRSQVAGLTPPGEVVALLEDAAAAARL
jgi:UDP:flavonoid glycosyltransferase YjiC (YdhE family)